MKTTGIILLVIGALSTFGGILLAIFGRESNFTGLTLVVLGGYLIFRANQKKEDAEKKKQWEKSSLDKQE